MVRQPFGPQTLTAAQVTDLQAAVASIDRKQCDRNSECDPCLVTRISVDGLALTDTCCGSVNGGFSGPFDALAAQIDTLVVRSAR